MENNMPLDMNEEYIDETGNDIDNILNFVPIKRENYESDEHSSYVENLNNLELILEVKGERFDSNSLDDEIEQSVPKSETILHEEMIKHESDCRCEPCKTDDGRFSPKSTVADERKPLYHCTDITVASSPPEEDLLDTDAEMHYQSSPSPSYLPQSSQHDDSNSVSYIIPKKQLSLTEKKYKVMDAITAKIMKRKNSKQANEHILTERKTKLLSLQIKHENIKKQYLSKLKYYDLKLKSCLLESATLDIEIKKRNL